MHAHEAGTKRALNLGKADARLVVAGDRVDDGVLALCAHPQHLVEGHEAYGAVYVRKHQATLVALRGNARLQVAARHLVDGVHTALLVRDSLVTRPAHEDAHDPELAALALPVELAAFVRLQEHARLLVRRHHVATRDGAGIAAVLRHGELRVRDVGALNVMHRLPEVSRDLVQAAHVAVLVRRDPHDVVTAETEHVLWVALPEARDCRLSQLDTAPFDILFHHAPPASTPTVHLMYSHAMGARSQTGTKSLLIGTSPQNCKVDTQT